MIHELYRGLNFVLIALVCLFLCAFQSVALKLPLLIWLELDLLLLVVVYLSLHRAFLEGTLLVLVIGRIAEIHSGALMGVLMASYLAVFLAILFTKELFLVGTSFSSIILAIAGGVIWKLAFLVLAHRYGFFANAWLSSLEFLLPFLLSLGLFARPVFAALSRIDQWTKLDRDSDSHGLAGEEF
jgi:hypothetical protein